MSASSHHLSTLPVNGTWKRTGTISNCCEHVASGEPYSDSTVEYVLHHCHIVQYADHFLECAGKRHPRSLLVQDYEIGTAWPACSNDCEQYTLIQAKSSSMLHLREVGVCLLVSCLVAYNLLARRHLSILPDSHKCSSMRPRRTSDWMEMVPKRWDLLAGSNRENAGKLVIVAVVAMNKRRSMWMASKCACGCGSPDHANTPNVIFCKVARIVPTSRIAWTRVVGGAS